jgi:hypothetical protein
MRESTALDPAAHLLHTGVPPPTALDHGFQLAFAIAITFPVLALLVGSRLRSSEPPVALTTLDTGPWHWRPSDANNHHPNNEQGVDNAPYDDHLHREAGT